MPYRGCSWERVGFSSNSGTLLYGMVTLSTDPGSAGDPLYVGISELLKTTCLDTRQAIRFVLSGTVEQPENSVSAINRLD